MSFPPIEQTPAETRLAAERSDQSPAMDRESCLGLLGSAKLGRVAVTMPDGAPVIRPVNFVFDQPTQSVLFRTADGSKFHALVRAGRAAFEIDGIDTGHRKGWSVVVLGVTEEVTDSRELSRLNRLELDCWAPGDTPHWVRIRANTISGRRVHAECSVKL